LRLEQLIAARAAPRTTLSSGWNLTARVRQDKFLGFFEQVVVDNPHRRTGLGRHRHLSPRPVRAPPATALGANLVRPVPTSRGADLDLSAFDDLFSDVENEAGSIDDLRTLPDRRDPFRSEPARRTHPGPSRDITGDRLSKSLSKKP